MHLVNRFESMPLFRSYRIVLIVEVQGLGPLFKLKLVIQNSGTKPIEDIFVSLVASEMYKVRPSLFQVC